MLIIQRVKGHSIVMDDGINSDMRIHVLDIYMDEMYGKMVKLAFDFPQSYKIYREEVACAIKHGMTLYEARKHIYQKSIFRQAKSEGGLDNASV